ncbi:hypothetical protein MBLNU230_g1163t1 [Neophaeotheca triangularis]
MLRLRDTPRSLLHLITAILLTTPTFTAAKPYPKDQSQRRAGIAFNQLFGRDDCAGPLCGWNNQLCCGADQACYTDSNQQAQCSSTAGDGHETAAPGGYYEYYTTTYVQTDLKTVTETGSSFVGGGGAKETGAGDAKCNYAHNETPCGDICCASGQYCYQLGQCKAAAGGGSSGHKTTYTAPATTGVGGSPFRPTSSSLVLVTETASPTTTVPFGSPVATGANVTLSATEEDNGGGGGLSGGAIAGIVIGVLAGLLLLGLICFYCCLKGLLDGCLALFGLGGGRKKRREREVDVYERHHHRGSHSHYGAAAAPAGRTWYGASKPSRPERRDSHSNKKGLLGLGAGLAGLAAALGLKRKYDERRNEKYESDYGSYSSDYYTSASSASSDDRRTRDTRRSMSRSRRY